MFKEKVSVIDSRCGSGKTQWSIKYMNENKDKRFIFVTPYLNECKRICENCTDFHEPEDKKMSKSDNFDLLVEENKNIATTHQLLNHLTLETIEKINNSNYELILDEVMDVVSETTLADNDRKALIELGLFVEDKGNLKIGDSEKLYQYDDTKWAYFNIVNGLKRKNLEIFENKILMWLFPIDIFNSFKKIFILTYMFDGYPMSPYFKFNNIEYKKYMAYYNENIGDFDIKIYGKEDNSKIKELIEIIEDEKLNQIGDDKTSFTEYWWRKKTTDNHLIELRKNISNIIKNKTKCKIDDILWTVFKTYQKNVVSEKTRDSNFISHNIRATNDYAEKFVCMYFVSRNYNPVIKRWFKSKNIEVNEDMFGLSEMIQWVFRSRIRKGENIILYVPSNRMRRLFKIWLDGNQPENKK